jgi:hypothetical protein
VEFRPHSSPEISNDNSLDVDSDINTLTETYVQNQAAKQWREPKYMIYSTYKQRLQSFAKWPPGKSPPPEDLSATRFTSRVGKVPISALLLLHSLNHN